MGRRQIVNPLNDKKSPSLISPAASCKVTFLKVAIQLSPPLFNLWIHPAACHRKKFSITDFYTGIRLVTGCGDRAKRKLIDAPLLPMRHYSMDRQVIELNYSYSHDQRDNKLSVVMIRLTLTVPTYMKNVFQYMFFADEPLRMI